MFHEMPCSFLRNGLKDKQREFHNFPIMISQQRRRVRKEERSIMKNIVSASPSIRAI
ncbi:MAG: hypothetical protein HUU50_13730 [Candidatus Brocadiae bacterium]|nr:hypothetical protein [Candidatus Brocadiia bacterium]